MCHPEYEFDIKKTTINQSINQSIDFYVVSCLRRNTLVRKDRDVFEHDKLSNLRL
jgi:hypothetical protein